MGGPFVESDRELQQRERILLVMQAGRDRELLQEWLAAQPNYDVVVCDPGGSLPEANEYDLCILDETSLNRSRSELIAHHREVEPTFLPWLLITPEERAVEVTKQLDDVNSAGKALINDTISLPVEKGILRRRIENLLEARRAFVRLRERERQYEELVDLAPEAILILRDQNIVYSNAAATDIFAGDDGTDLEEHSILSLVPDGEHSAFEDCLNKIENQARTEQFQSIPMQSVAGETRQTEIAGAQITFGNEPATQLLIRNVTDEYERRQRLDLFGRAIQTAVQGVTIADAQQEDNPLIYANNAFEEITGYSTAEILGRNCRFLQGEETEEATVTRMRNAIAEETPVSVEVLNYRKDGTPFWNQVDIVPVSDDEGDVTHFLGLQRDVTGRKSREERLQVLGRVLRHNLRNRMNVITGHAERLQSSDDPEVVESAAIIERSAQSLLAISEQIQEFSSLIDQSRDDLDSYDIVNVLKRIADGFRSTYSEATLRLD
ncbi:MAG: PAS domain S-box protein, partial [Halobacteriaceae archaeon]